MNVKTIELKNFRNYGSLSLAIEDKINIFYGKNAQGKTNLLESVYLCCVGKSLRGKDKELIKSGSDFSRITVSAEKQYGTFWVDIILSRRENKKISINDIPILKMGELMGGINCIYFSPDELSLIKDAPQCRRRFLDIDLSQVNKQYFYTLLSYNRTLQQRNNILKNKDKSVFAMLEVYDEQLSESGSYIIEQRKSFLSEIAEQSAAVHKYITDTEKLEISYHCSVPEKGETKHSFLSALKQSLDKDSYLGYTSVGPHRDDIKILTDGIDVRIYGSQGQQRTCALALKLGELSYFQKISGEKPILLLDDVYSELDNDRKSKLMDVCSTVQTLITTAETPPAAKNTVLYHVNKGTVKKTD